MSDGSIKERIKSAKTIAEVKSLLKQVEGYDNASSHTVNACQRRAKERIKALEDEAKS